MVLVMMQMKMWSDPDVQIIYNLSILEKCLMAYIRVHHTDVGTVDKPTLCLCSGFLLVTLW